MAKIGYNLQLGDAQVGVSVFIPNDILRPGAFRIEQWQEDYAEGEDCSNFQITEQRIRSHIRGRINHKLIRDYEYSESDLEYRSL